MKTICRKRPAEDDGNPETKRARQNNGEETSAPRGGALMTRHSVARLRRLFDETGSLVSVWCPHIFYANTLMGIENRCNISEFESVRERPNMLNSGKRARCTSVIIDGLTVGQLIAINDTGRMVFPVTSMPEPYDSKSRDLVVKVDDSVSEPCLHEVKALYRLNEMTSCVVNVVTSFSVRGHERLGNFTATVMERVIPMFDLVNKGPSHRVSMLLIRGLESAIAVQNCCMSIGAFNMDIRICNMGVDVDPQCVAHRLGSMCCPCRDHCARGVSVKIFDMGLLLVTDEKVETKFVEWMNCNMKHIANYISKSFCEPEYEELRRRAARLLLDTHISAGIEKSIKPVGQRWTVI